MATPQGYAYAIHFSRPVGSDEVVWTGAYRRQSATPKPAIGVIATAIGNAFDAFWGSSSPGSGTATRAYFSSTITPNFVDVIDLEDPSLGASESLVGNPGTGTPNYPPQIAACLTRRTDRRGRRFTGRLYMGPLASAAFSGPNLNATFVSDMEIRWGSFMSPITSTDPDLDEAVWSRVAEVVTVIAEYTMDNVPDTQRRRV